MRLTHRSTVPKQSSYLTPTEHLSSVIKSTVKEELDVLIPSINQQVADNVTGTTSHDTGQITDLQTAMTEVDVSMSEVKADIESLKTNVVALQNGQSSLTNLANATSQSVNALTQGQVALDTTVASLQQGQSSLINLANATSQSVDGLTQTQVALDTTVAQHKQETDASINNLDNSITQLPNWTGRLFTEMHPYCTTIWGNVGGSNIPSWIGSGSWINPVGLFDQSPRHGFLLTAAHVIDAASNITSIWILKPNSLVWTNHPLRRDTTNSGSQNVFEDTVTDIAVIKLNEVITQQYDPVADALFPKIHLGSPTSPGSNEATILTGDPVCMIGNPAGIDTDSFSFGHIRDAHYLPPTGSYECIAHHISSTGGNSGSPLFNYNREIVGMLTHSRTDANEFFFGPNWSTLSRVITYLFMSLDRKNTTLYGKGYRLEPNVYKTYPHEAVAYLNGNAQSISLISTSGIIPAPTWSSAYISSAKVFGLNGQILLDIQIGDQQGGRGIGSLHFIENVSHIQFEGAFLTASGQTNIWNFPNDASIDF